MVIKCKNGHWFDPNVAKTCPHCKRNGERLSLQIDVIEEDDKTVAIAEAGISFDEPWDGSAGRYSDIPASGSSLAGNYFSGGNFPGADDDRTVSFGLFDLAGIPPVTGWLICQNGGERGKDYRLHAGRNFVGRGNSMDVCLIDDKSISRDKHCSVTYDPKRNVFYLSAEGGNTVYINDSLLEGTVRLFSDDEITIGETRLAFVEYCKEGRKWDGEVE